MQNCTVKFGGNVAAEAMGKLQILEGGFILNYNLDGDDCTLCLKDGAVTQRRTGAVCVEIAFETGRRTECRYVDKAEGIDFSLPVTTNFIDYKAGDGAVALKLGYALDGEQTELEITAGADK